MISIKSYQKQLINVLQRENSPALGRNIFCKSLYVFLFLKIIFLWPVLNDIVTYLPFEFTLSLRNFIDAPIRLAQLDLHLFLILIGIIVLIALWVKVNYVTAALNFWLSFSVSRLTQPVSMLPGLMPPCSSVSWASKWLRLR